MKVDLALLLAVEAGRPAKTFEARNSLLKVLQSAPGLMAISSAGHIAVRLLGVRFGLPITGLASGFVSSTATIATMGQLAHPARLLQRTPVSNDHKDARTEKSFQQGAVKLVARGCFVFAEEDGEVALAQALSFSPDGSVFAVGGNDGKLQLWQTTTKQWIGAPLPGFTSRVRGIAFSFDGSLMGGGIDPEAETGLLPQSRRYIGHATSAINRIKRRAPIFLDPARRIGQTSEITCASK